MLSTPMTIHGGVRVAGADPNIKNLQLEELEIDPVNPEKSRIWLNTTDKAVRVAIGVNDDGTVDVVSALSTKDLTALLSMLAAKADAATTLEGYGITDALSSLNTVFSGVEGITPPVGTTLQRDATPPLGQVRFNSTTEKHEGYTGADAGWQDLTNVLLSLYSGNVGAISGTSSIAYDNSQPLASEGSQIWSQNVTAKSPDSEFVIDFCAAVDSSSNNRFITWTLWRDTTLIGFSMTNVASANRPQSLAIHIVDKLPAGVTDATYSLRCGIGGGSGTWYLGRGSSSTMGGANRLSWTIAEVA